MHDARWIGPLKRAAMALALVAALGQGAPAEEPPPLRVGMAPNYPPLAFKKNGHLQGIEVDFAKRLGPALNRKIEIIDTEWEQLSPDLDAKKIDEAKVDLLDPRQEKFNFTESYLTVGQMAIVRASDFPTLRDPKAMDRTKSRVGFVSRTTGEQWARANLKKAKLHGYTDTGRRRRGAREQSDRLLHPGRAGGVARHRRHHERAPEAQGLYRPLTTEQLAWAVPKDNPELLAQLNKVLEQWKKDGTLDDIIDDWITVKKTTIEVKPQ